MTLPDVTERPSHGMPAWFVGKKQFAVFSNDHHGDGRVALVCAAPDGMQQMLIDADPDAYYRPPYVGGAGWIGVRMDKGLAWEQIAAVVDSAHASRGGKRQVPMKHTFTATLREGAIEVPLDVKTIFGEARPPVKMTFCGETHKNRIAVYGGKYLLGIWKQVLEQHSLTDGNQLEVTIEPDDEPRAIVMPPELQLALANNAKATAGWDAMSFTHQREWAESIADAKGADTKARRVDQAIDATVAKADAVAAKAATASAKAPAKKSAPATPAKAAAAKPAKAAAKPAKSAAKPAKSPTKSAKAGTAKRAATATAKSARAKSSSKAKSKSKSKRKA
jgi:hypothetical protein